MSASNTADGRRRVLVTGALGAIGAWVMRTLLDRGDVPVAFDLGGSEHRLAFALSAGEIAALERVQGDVTDLPGLERALETHAVTDVIHLAALQVPFVREDPVAGARVNVEGTVNVLEAVRRRGAGMGPVVYASSIAALPVSGAYPGTLYGVFKRANEGTALRYAEDYGVASVGLRPHTIYGPGRDQGLTSAPTRALIAAAAGRPFHIPFGGSLQMHYAPDAGESFVRAGEAATGGASLHNLDGPVVSMDELIATIEATRPAARGLITADAAPLPFPSSADASSFVALAGGPVCRPLADGVRAALARFGELLAEGRVDAPER